MKISVVTDGGARTGMGHVHQSLALSRELRNDANIRFLTKSDWVVVNSIREAGFPVECVSDDTQLLALMLSQDPDVVLFDKIDVSVDLAKKIRMQMRARLVIFTNLTSANHYADMVVLPRAADLKTDVGSRFENMAYADIGNGAVFFYGPTYWVLRPEFQKYRNIPKLGEGVIRRILLTFGGSDPSDLTSLVVAKLLQYEQPLSIDVVVGSHYAGLDSLTRLLRSNSPRQPTVTVHQNISNVGALMHRSDLVITAAGMSMFEALCVQTPVIVIPQDQLQRETYEGVMRLLPPEQLGNLADMITRRDFTDPRDPFIEGMKIGEGIHFLTDCILQRNLFAAGPPDTAPKRRIRSESCT